MGLRCVLHQDTETCQVITEANSVGRVSELYIATFFGPQASISEKKIYKNNFTNVVLIMLLNILLLDSCIATNMKTELTDPQWLPLKLTPQFSRTHKTAVAFLDSNEREVTFLLACQIIEAVLGSLKAN